MDPALPWRRGGWGLVVILVLSILLVAGGFAAGRWLSPPQERAADTDAPVIAWTAVEKRAAPAPAPLTGRLRAGRAIAVTVIPPEGVERVVVTSVRVRVGQVVSVGDVLAIVSGRPLILVRNDFPFYRDLRPGDRGDDVRAVQQILRADGVLRSTADGEFGRSTQAALERFYLDRGLTAQLGDADRLAGLESAEQALAALPRDAPAADRRAAERAVEAARPAAGAWLPLGELVVVPSDRVTVDSVAARGAVIEDGAPVVTVRSGDVSATARADALAVEDYRRGTRVVVTLAGAPKGLPGVVTRIGPFVEGNGTAQDFPGRDVTVVFDRPPAADPGTTVTIRTTAATGGELVAVPLVALREDATGTFVLRRPPGADGVRPKDLDAAEQGERVPVEVQAQADGWALLGGTALTVGDLVRVGG